MKIRTLGAVAALLAAPCAVMAQAYLDNTTVANTATVLVGKTSTNPASAYLDVEGPGQGSFANYGLIDFSSIYYAPLQQMHGNTLDLALIDSPYTFTTPGSIDISLVTAPVSNYSTLTYGAPPASIPLPIQATYYAFPNSTNYTLLNPAGNNYTSTPGTSGGGTYDYQVTLSPAAIAYFNSVLNDPNGDLQLLVTADASTPNVLASYAGGAYPSPKSPLLGFNSVPEPGAALPLLMGLSAAGLLAVRRRR